LEENPVLKRFSTCIGVVTASALVFVAKPARAFNFIESYVTPSDVLDFTSLGYTYDYGYNDDFDVLPASAVATTGLSTRKNSADMTELEITDFVNALKTLKNTITTTDNGIQISIYDRFVATHIAARDAQGRIGPDGNPLANPGHGGSAFLPWHRSLLNEFEQALRSVDSDVFLPYWDWTNADATYNKIFQNSFMGPNGTGGRRGNEVATGHFSLANGWALRRDLSGGRWGGIDPTSQVLTRDLGERVTNLGTVENVTTALAQTDFLAFRRTLEAGTGLHNNMHAWIGGTMGNVSASPNDPMFWLLHANVDRIWAEWQISGHWGSSFYPGNGQRYGHNLNDPMFPWDNGLINIAADLEDLLPELPGTTSEQVINLMANQGFARNREELLTDVPGKLYNPIFGEGPEYYCYGKDQHHGWGDTSLHSREHEEHGTSSDEYLALDVDETELCDELLADNTDHPDNQDDCMDHDDHMNHDNHGDGHHCPLGMNCHGCNGISCPHHPEDQDPNSVPEPASALGLVALGAIGVGSRLKSKR
jgi:tyrosinase